MGEKTNSIEEMRATIFRLKADDQQSHKTHLRNFYEGEEMSVLITLDEYRHLVSEAAKLEERCAHLQEQLDSAIERIVALNEENDRLKAEISEK